MQSWLRALDELLTFLAHNPHSPTEKWIVVGVTAFFAIIIFGLVASMMRIANSDPARSTGIVVLGGLLMMLAAIAAKRYLAPMTSSGLAPWLPLAAAILTLLVAVIPISCLWQRSKYGEALMAWVATLVAAVIAVFLITAIYDAVMSGKKDASGAKRRNREIEKEFFGR
jgi:chromate transport protein ChrA